MEIGDIIFLIIMGLGFLSSLGGASKKKRRANKQRQRASQQSPPKPMSRPSSSTATKPRKSRLQDARERAMSQMEELLRELEGKPKAPPPPPPPVQQDELVVESQDLVLPDPSPPQRELPPSVPAARDGSLHKMFHDKYIRPVRQPKTRSKNPRAKRHLSPTSLREAVLLREILGKPKALD